jgi:para-aminobenzoate synthetase component 1
MWSDRTPPARLAELVARLRTLPLEPVPGGPWVWLQAGPAGPALLRNPLAAISYAEGRATVLTRSSRAEVEAPAFTLIDAALTAWSDRPHAVLAGYLSYDLAAELEELGPLPSDDLRLPQLHLALFDHWKDAMPPGGDEFRAGQIASSPDAAGFEAAVRRIVAAIHAGDIFQTNLCRRLQASFSGSAWGLFHRMHAINPARFAAFVHVDEQTAVLSSSPEQFLSVRQGVVESSPIKGTRPRGADAAADQALIADLLDSEKDRAELAMIVDVVRNDLGRVCETGSVQVAEHAKILTLPSVHHSYSRVRGRLRRDASVADLLRAAFPAASISGAPKIEAVRAALREERQLRGPAMGAIGWIGLNGDLELSVAIRTAFTSHGRLFYYAGCGITADSVPAAEYEESAHKAAAFLRALER